MEGALFITAEQGLAGDMMVSTRVSAMESMRMQTASMESVGQMLAGIPEMFADMQSTGSMGTICIPLYVGGTLLDEVIANGQTRQNLRSGGR